MRDSVFQNQIDNASPWVKGHLTPQLDQLNTRMADIEQKETNKLIESRQLMSLSDIQTAAMANIQDDTGSLNAQVADTLIAIDESSLDATVKMEMGQKMRQGAVQTAIMTAGTAGDIEGMADVMETPAYKELSPSAQAAAQNQIKVLSADALDESMRFASNEMILNDASFDAAFGMVNVQIDAYPGINDDQREKMRADKSAELGKQYFAGKLGRREYADALAEVSTTKFKQIMDPADTAAIQAAATRGMEVGTSAAINEFTYRATQSENNLRDGQQGDTALITDIETFLANNDPTESQTNRLNQIKGELEVYEEIGPEIANAHLRSDADLEDSVTIATENAQNRDVTHSQATEDAWVQAAKMNDKHLEMRRSDPITYAATYDTNTKQSWDTFEGTLDALTSSTDPAERVALLAQAQSELALYQAHSSAALATYGPQYSTVPNRIPVTGYAKTLATRLATQDKDSQLAAVRELSMVFQGDDRYTVANQLSQGNPAIGGAMLMEIASQPALRDAMLLGGERETTLGDTLMLTPSKVFTAASDNGVSPPIGAVGGNLNEVASDMYYTMVLGLSDSDALTSGDPDTDVLETARNEVYGEPFTLAPGVGGETLPYVG